MKASGGPTGFGGDENLLAIPYQDLIGALCATDDEKWGSNQWIDQNKAVVQAIPIQDGREIEKAQNGLGLGAEGDPAYTLDTTGAQAVFAYPLDLRNALRDPEKLDEQNRQGVGTGEDGDPAHTVTTAAVHGVAYELATFRKAKRAHNPDDDESWVEDDQANSLSTFDNTSDTRATSLVVEPKAFDEYNGTTNPETHQTLRAGTRQSTGVFFEPVGEIVGLLTTALNSPRGTETSDSKHLAIGAVSGLADLAIVRRLTPTECERLQGFPDGWTSHRVDFKTGQTVEQKDAPRYKQMGNAVAVPVVAWIAARIVAFEAGEL